MTDESPSPLQQTEQVTIFIIENEHSRFELRKIWSLLQSLPEGKRKNFRSLTNGTLPMSDDGRRKVWNGTFDRRLPKDITTFCVFNRVEDCKFKM
jgi:hypothetical protein